MIELPGKVFLLCKSGALLVGGAARSIIDQETDTIADYDLIVPPEKWYFISLQIPQRCQLNKHGGLRFTDSENNQIDIWPCSVEQHLRQCKGKNGKQEYVLDYINYKVFTSFIIGTNRVRK